MAVDTAYTYDEESKREDLLNILTNLSPTETQLVSGLGTGSASNIYHEWLTDTLSSVKANAYVEGVDASYPDLTDPSRSQNVTQIARQGYQVSDTERAVNSAGFNDRYAYEATKALKVLKNDMEYALMRGSLACGSGTDTARQLKGIKNWLSLVTNQSTASMSETDLNDYFQNVWDNGTEVNAIYAPMYMKRKISNFAGNSTQQNIDVTDKRLINSVDVLELIEHLKPNYMLENPKAIQYLKSENLMDIAMGNQQGRLFGWLAGIIDGEGTISIQADLKRKRFTPIIAVTNTDIDTIDKVSEIFSAIGIKHRTFTRHTKNYGGCDILSLRADGYIPMCLFLYSFGHLLITKNEQVQLMAELMKKKIKMERYFSPITEKEISMMKAIRDSNRPNRTLRDYTLGTGKTVKI